MGNDPDECIAGVCWKDSSYPLEEIETNFNSNPHYEKTFGKSLKVGGDIVYPKPCGLCETKLNIKIKPLSFKGSDGIKKYLLHTTKYQHHIKVVVCKE